MTIDMVLGAQWGDESKGAIVDRISSNYDYVARCTGGDNAGHSILVDGKLLKLHLIPCCVWHSNVRMVLGAGMVINPVIFKKEVINLRENGIDINTNNLFVSNLAHLLTNLHISKDVANEERLGKNKIGTTKRGITPCYVDKYNRTGIRLKDILDVKKLSGLLLNDSSNIDSYLEAVEFLIPFIKDTRKILYNAINIFHYKVLAEGAQGALLDISWGKEYPFVTSSDTTIYGCLAGLGIGVRNIGRIIGVVKSFQTRVAAGEFPTEITDESLVLRLRGDGSKIGDEFGSTTGRPRRIGWLDIPYLKYAIELNSINEIALTKLDVFTGLEKIKICTKQDKEYIELPGWEYLGNTWEEFPKEAKYYVEVIETLTDTPVTIIGIGPERNAVVYKW